MFPFQCLAILNRVELSVEGVRERLELEESASQPSRSTSRTGHIPQSSRRRKGPVFLPSEHDELPPDIAFMVMIHPLTVTKSPSNAVTSLLRAIPLLFAHSTSQSLTARSSPPAKTIPSRGYGIYSRAKRLGGYVVTAGR